MFLRSIFGFGKIERRFNRDFIFQNNQIFGSEKATWENFENHTPIFKSYWDFFGYALKE